MHYSRIRSDSRRSRRLAGILIPGPVILWQLILLQPILLLVGAPPCLAGDRIDLDGSLALYGHGYVKVADLDADGFPDLVAAPLTGNMHIVYSYLRRDDRFFADPIVSGFSEALREFELADTNGDGLPDLLGFTDTAFLVALGNGDGTFEPPQLTLATGEFARSVAVGDFNGDRRPDVAMVLTSGEALIFLNDDGSGFLPARTIDVFGAFAAMDAADFDNDGHLDLFVRWSLNSAVVFGRGDGDFMSRTEVTSGFTIRNADAIDWNGDGNIDIVLDDGSISVLLGDGRRGFHQGPSVALDGSVFETGDFNGDGRTDLIRLGDVASVFLGTADGDFVLTRETEGRIIAGASSRLATDIDLDGRDDWILGAVAGARILFGVRGRGINDVTGQFGAEWAQAMVPGDLNGDGVDDLVRRDHILFGTPDGTFYRGPDHDDILPRRIVDLDGNGTNDLLAIRSSTFVEAYLNDGAGNLVRVWNTRLTDPTRIHLGQVNDLVDDIRDFVVLEEGTNASVPYFGNGDGTFTEGPRVNVGTDPTFQTTGDFDEDGHLDVVVSRPGFLRIRFGDGFGTFPTFSDIPSAEVRALGKPDINNDGHLDLFSLSTREFHVHLGNGDGTFASPWTVNCGTDIGVTRLRDLNADGLVDLALTTFEHLWVFRGNGVDFDSPRRIWIGRSDDRPSRETLPNLAILSSLDAPVLDVAIAARGGGLGGGIYVSKSRRYDAVACADGDVNRGAGVRADVLHVNGSSGDGPQRRVVVSRTAPLEIRMEAPPSTRLRGLTNRDTAPFVVYASVSAPARNDVRRPDVVAAALCFPSPVTDVGAGNVVRIWNNLGDEETFGSATDPSMPAPSVIESSPHGPDVPGFVGMPANLWLQGVIRDTASPSGELAVTNAVMLCIE